MVKGEGAGMESLSREQIKAVADKLLVFRKGGAFKYSVTAILLIVEERMPLPGHMHPYLMGSAGLKAAFNQ
jgi:hypothetical protein